MKETYTNYRAEQAKLNLHTDILRARKQTRYCDWIISACAGASIALIFVIIHQMIVTNWTW